MDKHLALMKFPANIAYNVTETSTIVGMVKQGLGAAIVARLVAEPILPEMQVCSLPVPLKRVIGVAVLANTLHSPAVFAFLETILGVDRFTQKTAV
ncbi:LysR substrate-binding domain-containing protein [Scytonema sp. PRP1]|uniref:LysR substrate-binding domain-containing protein n=1 Tax=Scytonema sp. PRP1 TaxID=3120513 RepID=UPI002FCF058D